MVPCSSTARSRPMSWPIAWSGSRNQAGRADEPGTLVQAGTEESACFTVDAAGYPLADGGFNATLRDYARFGLMMMNGGIGNGMRLVPQEWIDDILRCDPTIFGEPYTEARPTAPTATSSGSRTTANGPIMARGVFGQLIHIDPGREHGRRQAVELARIHLGRNAPLDTYAAVRAIADHLNGRNAS